MNEPKYLFNSITSGSTIPKFEICDYKFGISCKSAESKSLCWYDNMGSIGKFFNLLGYNKQESFDKDIAINRKLIDLKANNLVNVSEDIRSLLMMLPTNVYTAQYHESQEITSESRFKHYNIIFPRYDNGVSNDSDLEKDYSKVFMKTIQERGNNRPPRILDIASINFYDEELSLLSTKHKNTLNKERITYYCNLLDEGKRPAIIAIGGESNYGSINPFILDGHHKAAAYQQKKIEPSVILISSPIPTSSNTIDNLMDISDLLFRCQMEHVISSNFMHEKVIEEIYNSKSLRKYIKNGEVKEYYPNGQLKVEGNYKMSKRDGYFTYFFPDGSSYKKERYQLEQLKATYEKFHHKGQLLIKGDENGINEQYNIHGQRIK